MIPHLVLTEVRNTISSQQWMWVKPKPIALMNFFNATWLLGTMKLRCLGGKKLEIIDIMMRWQHGIKLKFTWNCEIKTRAFSMQVGEPLQIGTWDCSCRKRSPSVGEYKVGSCIAATGCCGVVRNIGFHQILQDLRKRIIIIMLSHGIIVCWMTFLVWEYRIHKNIGRFIWANTRKLFKISWKIIWECIMNSYTK